MRMRKVVVFIGILSTLNLLWAVKGDDSLEAWSCSPDARGISDDYQQKVWEALNAMEVEIMNHKSWDLVCHATGVSEEDVVGCAGCIPSKDMTNTEDCYACILEARAHLMQRCPSNVRGSAFLNSCTLLYSRVERTSVAMEWDKQTSELDRQTTDQHFLERMAEL